ncbi:helix-turn-helix domain-containing protein [Georgenia yuyongxinii]|uniref:Helix-turn-helix domain-containing protein n=1 Tax=Georgenia yuyongxinii TaxID=2589797 RepID=A0A5B8C1U9_9MICO|nr:IclR family transcriptional regulator C-terminal domain-containing protein [Georgenia yuyongxinii]QDC24514.1 helix-turn-helix domain-containing protein [Georgenia yuyongxinii]
MAAGTDPDAPTEGLQSLGRGLAVIRALAAAGEPLTLAQVAQATSLNRAVARRVLLTLVEVGYVLARGREFSLRPRVLELGEAYRTALRLPELALGPMRGLVETTGQSCSMAVLDGADIVYVQRVPGRRIIDAVIHVGTRLPAAATAMGRVLLAALDDAELDAVLDRDTLEGPTSPAMPGRTVERAALRAAVEEVRRKGYCRVDQEFERGLTTLAAPVRDVTGAVVAAVNLPLSTYTLPDGQVPEELVDAIRATAAQVTELAVRAQVSR